jgi:hypothetical protein
MCLRRLHKQREDVGKPQNLTRCRLRVDAMRLVLSGGPAPARRALTASAALELEPKNSMSAETTVGIHAPAPIRSNVSLAAIPSNSTP